MRRVRGVRKYRGSMVHSTSLLSISVFRRHGLNRFAFHQSAIEEIAGCLEDVHPGPPQQRIVDLVGENDLFVGDVMLSLVAAKDWSTLAWRKR